MTRRLLFATAVLCAIVAVAAPAADISGNWSGTIQMDGNPIPLTYAFKQDGEKLTGTVAHPDGAPLQLNEGKVLGDKVTFFIQADIDGAPTKFVCEGTIMGDEITLSTKVGGQEFGGGPIVLKRVK